MENTIGARTDVEAKEVLSNTLVSFCLRSHNQKEYFREALLGAFAQDYSPLEICIYDDCSTDGSDEMIRSMIDKYEKEGGRHEVIYVHGESNVGNVHAAEKMYSLAHGVLCVQNDGDDISLSNRVSRTVEAWIQDGRRARLIHCGAWMFDGKGIFGEMESLSAFHPRGACVAYMRDVFSKFSAVDMHDAYEDRPYACRAFILGPELYIPDKLVLYRVDVGASTSLQSARQIRSFEHTLAGIEQNYIDLQFAKTHGWIDECRYNELLACVDEQKLEFSKLHSWLAESSVLSRWRHGPYNLVQIINMFKMFFKGGGRHPGNLLPLVRIVLILLPFRLGFPLLDWFNAKWEFMRRRRNRKRYLQNTQAVKNIFRGVGLKLWEN